MVDRQVGRAFNDHVLLKFNKNGRSDPQRPSVEISAILHLGHGEAVPLGTSNDRYNSELTAASAQLFIDRSVYHGIIPSVKDEVRALDLDGQPWFEVLAVSDRTTNLIVLTLGATA